MKFSIDKPSLLKEISFVNDIIERKSKLQSINNILIEAEDKNILRITGTDLDITISCITEAQIFRKGSILIPAQKLYELTKQLPDAQITFEDEVNNRMKVSCERSQFKLPAWHRNEFPVLPDFKEPNVLIPSKILLQMISTTIFAVTVEESKYALSGIKLLINKEGLSMVATDGHRLSFARTSDTKSNRQLDILIPKKAIGELQKMLVYHEGDVGISTDKNHVYFEAGPRVIIARLLGGQFPNYEMIFPKETKFTAVVNRSNFRASLRRVSVMSESRTNRVVLKFSTGQIDINAKAADLGEAEEHIEADYKGDDLEVGFNCDCVQQFLDTSKDEQLKVEMNDSLSQVLISPMSRNNMEIKYVVMPLRL
jgi:DNA polymerase III subunit beta